MAVTTRLELALSSLTAKRINPFSYVTKFEFLLRFQTHSTLTQNRTEIVGLEDLCTIHCTIRVYLSGGNGNRTHLMFCLQNR